ncbi:hypothetical protein CVT24_003870 [Panaeolus cyanescens]|uniref:Uncharacterized protein n=1 Tax=Panaeolus cyanescens TaxID=181874 RepID=A0A409VV32_9AGAR|nr:hypothetical protein CVT24_003870 [Panaeolus cyanescens]
MLAAVRAERERAGLGRRQQDGPGGLTRTIDVHFNVVAGNMTEEGGWVPDRMIQDQMELLNDRFTPTGIQFRYRSTTRIISNYLAHELFLPESGDSMKPSTFDPKKPPGPNVPNAVTFGFASQPPFNFIDIPVVHDGAYIRYDVMPGGPIPYDQGFT